MTRPNIFGLQETICRVHEEDRIRHTLRKHKSVVNWVDTGLLEDLLSLFFPYQLMKHSTNHKRFAYSSLFAVWDSISGGISLAYLLNRYVGPCHVDG